MLGWLGVLASAMLWQADDGGVVLNVPYRSQLNGTPYALANCGPASLSMVLAYYDIDSSLWDLRVRAMKAQKSWVDDDGGYSHDYGVFVYNLATVAESMGLQVRGLWAREGNRIERLREWRAHDIRSAVSDAQPVILQVLFRALPGNAGSSYAWDHYIVVHGVVGERFVYSDPLDVRGGGPGRVISAEDLEYAMSKAKSPRAGFAVYRRSI